MNTTTTTTIPAEGETVWVEGHEFIARNVRVVPNPNHPGGGQVVRFHGIATANPCNNLIRHTPYNGGTYGWRVS